ncbi:ecdysone 20-monooxygenase [Eupeodes corollae]|uniref:ecdysone 20-monooxygenase n=1 Tax=Eupeodes corollae TaxID=290404 RepID=UPI0024901C6D|nr:ecdysone 20-monooxygenase [Eupeodes corollae]XP_055907959.1 ecdysone 20-monooxygenase [Eupeodes corollae]XP_055907960.1 ecdysone 20-monooxygenase [Eupeodes corollae]XP_055907961.1 ecdysone 20-monooxygenase [Eupeodes corollae]
MAFILLISLAILLVIYLNYNFQKLQSSLFSLGKRCDKLTVTKKGIWDIPGPYPVPFLGTKWTFLLGHYKLSQLHEAYKCMNEKYGPIVLEVTPGGVPIAHLFDKSDIEKILKYPSKYPFRPPTEIVVYYRNSRPDRYASVGITNEQGPTWQRLRSALTSHITSPKILQNFLPSLNSVCDDFIELIRHRRNPNTWEVKNFEDIANLMGLEAVCTLMLGRRMGFLSTESEQPEKVKLLAKAVKQLFVSQRDSYYGYGLWKYIPTKTYSQFSKSEDYVYDMISEMVEQALRDEEFEVTNFDDDDLKSIFISILQLKDIDIRDKKSAIIDFVAAGIETLANTLIFVLNFVTSSGNATEQILDEFRAYSGSVILQDTITNAKFTKACLQETYRLQPTAFCLARILEEDTILSGYELKSGTVVLCQNMIACHKNTNFKNAMSFIPERWIEKGAFNVNIESSSIVVPFGIGKRTCPGKRFVEMEVILLLAKMILAFDISFPKPLETEFEFLLVPKTPVSLILRDRSL